jgi:hypothetical protein
LTRDSLPPTRPLVYEAYNGIPYAYFHVLSMHIVLFLFLFLFLFLQDYYSLICICRTYRTWKESFLSFLPASKVCFWPVILIPMRRRNDCATSPTETVAHDGKGNAVRGLKLWKLRCRIKTPVESQSADLDYCEKCSLEILFYSLAGFGTLSPSILIISIKRLKFLPCVRPLEDISHTRRPCVKCFMRSLSSSAGMTV